MVKITERPIIFSQWSIPLVLSGLKTQTRRIVKKQPMISFILQAGIALTEARKGKLEPYRILEHKQPDLNLWRDFVTECLYGQPGDHLWVKESWAVSKELDKAAPRQLEWLTSSPDFPQSVIYYKADSVDSGVNPIRGRWRSSRFMPRWASRITLEITSVQVERLQDITLRDCLAEGITMIKNEWGPAWFRGIGGEWITARGAFQELWDSINAKKGMGWEVNPWVWTIEFKLAQEKED